MILNDTILVKKENQQLYAIFLFLTSASIINQFLEVFFNNIERFQTLTKISVFSKKKIKLSFSRQTHAN